MKTDKRVLRFIRIVALMLTAFFAAIQLFGETASAQSSCANAVAPGDTINITQATTGSVSSPQDYAGGLGGMSAGAFNLSTNTAEAWANDPTFFNNGLSASGSVNYIFCVPGHPGDTVTATISAQVIWNGILAGESLGGSTPSVTGYLTLVDLGSGGAASNLVASANPQPLSTNLATMGIGVTLGSAGLNVNFGYSNVVGGGAASISSTNVIVGHYYAVVYTLTCNAPPPYVIYSFGFLCDFSQNTPYFAGIPAGSYGSSVTSVSVSLGPDQYGEILAISNQIAVNNRAIANEQLVLEQENAQLLGIINKLESQLLKSQPANPDPPMATPRAAVPNPRSSACSSSSDSNHKGGFWSGWFSALFGKHQACP